MCIRDSIRSCISAMTLSKSAARGRRKKRPSCEFWPRDDIICSRYLREWKLNCVDGRLAMRTPFISYLMSGTLFISAAYSFRSGFSLARGIRSGTLFSTTPPSTAAKYMANRTMASAMDIIRQVSLKVRLENNYFYDYYIYTVRPGSVGHYSLSYRKHFSFDFFLFWFWFKDHLAYYWWWKLTSFLVGVEIDLHSVVVLSCFSLRLYWWAIYDTTLLIWFLWYDIILSEQLLIQG